MRDLQLTSTKQNREAQRRFCERKEEGQQVLEQKAAKLEARIAELSSGVTQKSEEESKILREERTGEGGARST
jgi:hypothetical protein